MSVLGKREILKGKIFSLQEEVSEILSIDNDVDKFLDNTFASKSPRTPPKAAPCHVFPPAP